MSDDRLYVVTDRSTGTIHLIEAGNAAQAAHRLMDSRLEVHVAKATEVGRLMRAGVEIVTRPDQEKLNVTSVTESIGNLETCERPQGIARRREGLVHRPKTVDADRSVDP